MVAEGRRRKGGRTNPTKRHSNTLTDLERVRGAGALGVARLLADLARRLQPLVEEVVQPHHHVAGLIELGGIAGG